MTVEDKGLRSCALPLKRRVGGWLRELLSLFKKTAPIKTEMTKAEYEQWKRTDPWAIAVQELAKNKVNRRFISDGGI